MIKNYIKTAFRTLVKNKGFTAINILGLALGLTICLLIAFYVADELSYDRYNAKADRTYRVNEDLKLGNNSYAYAVCMAPLAQALKIDFPEVENTTRIKMAGTVHIIKGNETLLENNTAFADPTLFDVFTLPMLQGDPATALTEPNSVVITQSTAAKYFNAINVVGKTLMIDKKLFKITGVIRDVPKQSHFNFDFFLSMSTYPGSRETQWLRSDFNTYVVLKTGADRNAFEAKLPAFLVKHSAAEMQNDLHQTIETFEKSGNHFNLNLIPITDIHLYSNLTGELQHNGTSQYVYLFLVIALFILLIACINFINLSTARSSGRAREIGVRKVLGSARKYLIAQFLTESVLVTLVSAIIALILAIALLPAFNQLAGKQLSLTAQSIVWLAPTLLGIVILIGVIAGSYPAFFLSAFKPTDVLKGKLSAGLKSSRLRGFLVVFQFSVSIILIVGTLVVYRQLNYIQSKNLGYNRSEVLVIRNVFELGNQAKTFNQEVKQLPGVINTTMTGFLPTTSYRNAPLFYKDATLDPKKSILPQVWTVDEDYVGTMDMKMVDGRNFSRQMLTDSSGLIINEAAVKSLGLSKAVNSSLYRGGYVGGAKAYHIIGVVKDFNFSSLKEPIGPLFMLLGEDKGNISVRIKTANVAGLIALIKNKWNNIGSDKSFDYSFMDADFDASYRSEQRVGTLFMIFTTLSIIIACLGLFGLAAYAAEQRNKEIGIRKVLGASVANIVAMLSADFIKLICIAMLIALPVAWYVMYKWLQNFAYRESIHWWVLAAAGIIALLIALITISFQSIKAALTNPVKSLKNE